MDEYASDRTRMVQEQIERRGLIDERLLVAFKSVPRHLFIPREYRHYAYDDGPLPIGFDQTISQPYIVALMTNLLELIGDEHILEVGTGSGYQAAILSQMGKDVHTVERIPALYTRAENLLKGLGYQNVHCHLADGSLGLSSDAPYGGILVTAAAPSVPQELLAQLAEGGRLVLPVGGGGYQVLEIWRRENGILKCRSDIGVAFVPLRGERGWK